MSYVFDSGPLSWLFHHYYRKRFPSLWERFDVLVDGGCVVSTREVLREIQDAPHENLREWAANNHHLFATPTAAEGVFVGQIYAVPHFQHNIEQQKLLKGGKLADPFVIARASVEGCAVVTTEKFKPNGAKVPNICKHFGVECLSLEDFMEREEWEF
jgi:hypothetical protein